MSLPRSSAAPCVAYPSSRTTVPSSQIGTASSRHEPAHALDRGASLCKGELPALLQRGRKREEDRCD